MFYCSNCSSFGHWYLFHLAPICLSHTPTIVSSCYFTSLFPGPISCSRIILYISCPILEQSFLHGALFPFTRAWYWKPKSQYLGVLIAMVLFTEFGGVLILVRNYLIFISQMCCVSFFVFYFPFPSQNYILFLWTKKIQLMSLSVTQIFRSLWGCLTWYFFFLWLFIWSCFSLDNFSLSGYCILKIIE